MRISDWSSDVCSSDLASVGGIGAAIMVRDRRPVAADWSPFGSGPLQRLFQIIEAIDRVRIRFFALVAPDAAFPAEEGHVAQRDHGRGRMKRQRSDEHTSELQSLMRISYAVFSLTTKQHNRRFFRLLATNTIH